MLQLRSWKTLGGGDHGWLKARHHFAVDDDANSAHAPLGNLVIWNDDEIAPQSGFPTHGHRDMEIITYVREGVLQHEDSFGGRGEIHAGDVQVMSAGRGIRHREFNATDSLLRVFQIWLLPRRRGIDPRWSMRRFPEGQQGGELIPLASGFPQDRNALQIDADARVLGATLKAGQRVTYTLQSTRGAYMVAAFGQVSVNGQHVGARDGIAITNESEVSIEALESAAIILVDTRV